MPWTTTELLQQIKLRSYQPDSDGEFADAELLALADSALQSELFPLLLKARGEYRLEYQDTALVADQALYRLPSRAHAGRLADVKYYGSGATGAESDGVSLTRTSQEQLGHAYSNSSGIPCSFYLRDDFIGLYPVPSSATGTLRCWYYMRLGQLVVTTDAAQITALSGTQIDFGTGLMPSAWTTSTVVDFIGGFGTFPTLGIDAAITTVNTDQLIMSATPPSTLAVGDWVAVQYQSPIPQVPEILHAPLAQLVATQVLESTGELRQKAAAETKARILEAVATDLMAERVDGESKRYVPRYTTLRSGRGVRRRRYA